MAKKVALVIGVSDYASGFSPLPAATKDAEEMKRVLEHPDIGNFDEVRPLPDPDEKQMRTAIESLFSNRTKDDLLLLFFSGHGVKDDSGELFFATRETDKHPEGRLRETTAVPSSFLQKMMKNCNSTRVVVILDCCFSGAFTKDMLMKSDDSCDVKDEVKQQLGGEGRVILTSSTSTQPSVVLPGSDLSIYTRYLVEGIEGAADSDEDGMVSIAELHEYTKSKVRETHPAMKPEIYAFKEGYKIQLSQTRKNGIMPCIIMPLYPETAETPNSKSYKECIRTACRKERFESKIIHSYKIDEDILAKLETAPFVVFYLGDRQVDNKFVFMMGYRHSTGLPTLYCAHDETIVTDLPGRDVVIEPLPSTEETCDTNKGPWLDKLCSRIREAFGGTQSSRWSSKLPWVTIRMDFSRDEDHRIIEWNESAPKLFQLDNKRMYTASLKVLMEQLQKFMRKAQWAEFMKEQDELVKSLSASRLKDRKHVFATKPICFKEDAGLDREFSGRAFLPIIVRYSHRHKENALMLLVVYIDVTDYLSDGKGKDVTDYFSDDKDKMAFCHLFHHFNLEPQDEVRV